MYAIRSYYVDFDGSNYFSFGTGGMIFSDQSNFTIEFWFKANTPSGEAYLFGNGLADGNDGYESAWAIVADASDNIIIRNNGADFSFSAPDYFDNNWHHLAVVVNRITSYNVCYTKLLRAGDRCGKFTSQPQSSGPGHGD